MTASMVTGRLAAKRSGVSSTAVPTQPGCQCWCGVCLCHVSMHGFAWRRGACCSIPKCVRWPHGTRGIKWALQETFDSHHLLCDHGCTSAHLAPVLPAHPLHLNGIISNFVVLALV